MVSVSKNGTMSVLGLSVGLITIPGLNRDGEVSLINLSVQQLPASMDELCRVFNQRNLAG